MRVYLLKDSDFETLLDNLDRDPKHGYRGGSSTVLSEQERQIYDDAHRFYNYQIRVWLGKVKSGDERQQ